MSSSCPICQKPLVYADEADRRRLMPFCSARCKLIDLGEWMSERYRVASDERIDDGEAADSRGEE
jgi:endogenous inhibitor of DNA gyrase (YacG/DUF329 family)